MNCPFSLPVKFELKTSFERKLKKLDTSVQQEVAQVIDYFVSGEIPEKYRPRKIQQNQKQDYRIRIGDYRIIYNLEEKENEENVGILKTILPRPKSYRKTVRNAQLCTCRDAMTALDLTTSSRSVGYSLPPFQTTEISRRE